MNSDQINNNLFNLNPLPTWIYDYETLEILDVNNAAIELYGYTREEFLTLNLKDLRPPREVPKLINAHTDIKNKEGNIYFGIFTHQKKNGDLIQMEINGHKVDFNDRNCMLVVCQDVTERKTAELAVLESEAKFKNFFEIASLGIIQVDPLKGRIILANSYYETITGYTNDELLKMSFVDLTHPEDREKDWELFSKAAEGEEEYRNEKRYVKKDGTIVWVRLHVAFIRDKIGKPIKTVAICEDITNRKESEARLQNLTDNIPGVVFQYLLYSDDTDELRFVSKGSEKIWGYSPEAVTKNVDLVWNQTKAGGDFEAVKQSIKDSVENKSQWSIRYRTVTPDGEKRTLQGLGTPEFLDDGTVLYNSFVFDITNEAKNIELLERATNLAKIGSWEIDMTANKLFWSDMVHELHETDPESFEPDLETVINFYREDFRKMVNEEIAKCVETGVSFDFEAVVITANNQERWVRAIGNAEMVDGNCERIYGSFQDIHDRKESELRLKSISNDLPGVTFQYVISPDGTDSMQGVSKAAYDVWNISPKECELNNDLVWNQIKKGGDFEAVQQSIQESIEQNKKWNFRWRNILPNGEVRWHEGYGSPNKLVDETIVFNSLIFDITERKKAEEENRFKANLLSTIGQAAIATNLDGIINYWNKAAENIYGWKRDEALGKNILLLTPNEANKAQAIQIMEMLKRGESWSGQFNVRKKDGAYFPAYVTNSPIYDENNILTGIIGISSDITKETENEELLRLYTKELERSNEELEQFAFVTSHDLQEPLRMISSFLTQLEKKYGDQLDEKAQQYIDFAIDGAKRMKQIILDLLDYSRAGQPTESMEQVDLGEILSEFKLLRRKIISEKSVTISASDLPTIHSYKAAITQVLHSLLDNAIKYSKEGIAPHIEINATETKDEWTFSVKDNGIGIDSEFYDKIFIIFQRLHNKNEYGGTGIGLSIAKKHVEFLGGKIWLESTAGDGSIFYFTIPKMIRKTIN